MVAGGADASKGMFTKETNDFITASLGYDSENYGGGLIYTDDDTDTSFGGGVYFRPDDNFPTISVSYDSLSDSDATDSSSLMIGLDYEVGPGTASAAYESKDTAGTTTSNYEAYYNYPINDGVSVQGGVFVEEKSGSTQDTTGYIVETFFSF